MKTILRHSIWPLAFLLFVLLRAEDPAMLKRDGKDAARVHRLLLHQQIDTAEVQQIFARYAVTHNCPTLRAGLNSIGLLACEIPPPPPAATPATEKPKAEEKPKPEPAKEDPAKKPTPL